MKPEILIYLRDTFIETHDWVRLAKILSNIMILRACMDT